MESIIHPISGEKGYFTTEAEKNIIQAILFEHKKQPLLTSSDARGVGQ